uniref:Uncharacterized protein n=1 Tax=Arion vulgaris TaxID=1028688 RepID=A0A0B7BKV6_9EUPU
MFVNITHKKLWPAADVYCYLLHQQSKNTTKIDNITRENNKMKTTKMSSKCEHD